MRHALHAVLAVLLVGAPAAAQSTLTGEWLFESQDPRHGSVWGTLRFEQGQLPGSYTYVRRIAGGETERGDARVSGSQIDFSEQQQASSPGFFSWLFPMAAASNATAPRTGVYQLSQTQQVLTGSFQYGSSALGTETLRRRGPTLADNRVDLLIDGPAAFPAIFAEISAAQNSICLQTYSWFDDVTGRQMADLLRAKVAQGVEVRCLIEAIPQWNGLRWDIGPYLRAGGVEVLLHHTVQEGIRHDLARLMPGSSSDEQRGLLNHDHRKLIVVDGRAAFTGGMNIGDKYAEGITWHDIQVRVEGSAVPQLERLFYERWYAAGGHGSPTALLPTGPGPGSLSVEILDNLPGLRADVTDRYLAEIRNARHEILIENPYFLYDPVIDAVQDRVQNGVRVVLIIPADDLNDEALARDAFLWVQNDLVRSGLEIYRYQRRMCHGKVAVFDDLVATVGTTNLDTIAMERNAEVNLFVTDRGFARTVEQSVFDVDLSNSIRVVVQPLSWWDRVRSGVMHSLRSFL